MLVVGLTGGIGSGKSTVARMLAEHGAVIIDADAIARELRQPGGAAYQNIVDQFGSAVVTPDGRLVERQGSAGEDAEATRAHLRALTYPHLDRAIAERIARERGTDNVVVLDVIPLLAERGPAAYGLAGVIVVDAPTEVTIRRITVDRGIPDDVARARVAAQMSREERLGLADVVIDNSGPVEGLLAQVDALWTWLLTKRDHAKTS